MMQNLWLLIQIEIFATSNCSNKLGNFGTVLQLIVWAPTREKAIARMKRALDDTIITGNYTSS
jgi:biotin carboxylase